MIYLCKTNPSDFSTTDNLFQTHFWGNIKEKSGQISLYFDAVFKTEDCPEEFNFPLLVFLRKMNGLSYAYVPKAPPLSIPRELRPLLLEDLSLALKEQLPQDTVFLRYDLIWYSFDSSLNGKAAGNDFSANCLRPELLELKMNYGTKTHNLRKAPKNYLPADSVVINLKLSPEQLLMNMRQQTRNSIRRAYREEIEFLIYDCSSPNLLPELKKWHQIYENTGKRKGFYFEEYSYFENLFTTEKEFLAKKEPVCRKKDVIPMNAAVPPPRFYLFTAYKGKTLLSGLVLAICGKNAFYMYAASSLEKRDCMPNYGLQWEVIRFARSQGCTQYDLMGIPPDNDKENPMAGLYIFKTGFGGRKIHFEGTWDFPLNQEEYKKIRTFEQF
ncbi:MAG: peptidoglycan bridge formation glycyltransferase FemA/FemB family protein [Spirochaetia bacterium]|nr:peptidoglycan bridge formation glycyltransferase FemA/FemB family protein [Spirochaetia bacterium]